jgi:hypothetical protein
MYIDLLGRVKNTRLPARHGLMPLFEAVVNAIIAIEEAGRKDGRVEIRIERDSLQPVFNAQFSGVVPVKNFSIEDNGIGFTEANFASFETMDSQAKASLGGKGIGRLLWLKTFDHTEIESIYVENDTWYRRRFEFHQTKDGIEHHSLETLSSDSHPTYPKTTIRLVSFQSRYRDFTPKTAEAIARRIIEHCMEYFLLGSSPNIVVIDPLLPERIELQQLFAAEYRPVSSSREFQVGATKLSITDVLLKPTSDSQHRVHFCAHNRVVESVPLTGRISHLDGPLTNLDGEPVMYSGYVTGTFLDEQVDAERTSFSIDREGTLQFDGGSTWEDLISTTISSVSEYLEPLTVGSRERTLERIRTYVEYKEPKYRPLLAYRREQIAKLSGNLSDTNLDLELHKILNDWRHETRREAQDRLAQVDAQPSDFAKHREGFRRVIGELQEISKSDLAEYVIDRATILSYFEKLLGTQGNGRFVQEDALHGLFFPQRHTSDEIDYDDHSLWLIDERLAYHRFLASDLPLSKHNGPIEVDSNDRPDLLIYNNPIAFAPGQEPFPSVVIIEFKRPERADYDEEKSPIRQILRYVEQILNGKAKRLDGSTIEPPPHMPFYCYVIATLTSSLRRDAQERGFTSAPDGLGYFNYNSNFNAYIEISSYRKVLDDAKKRNQALFDRLQIKLN